MNIDKIIPLRRDCGGVLVEWGIGAKKLFYNVQFLRYQGPQIFIHIKVELAGDLDVIHMVLILQECSVLKLRGHGVFHRDFKEGLESRKSVARPESL